MSFLSTAGTARQFVAERVLQAGGSLLHVIWSSFICIEAKRSTCHTSML